MTVSSIPIRSQSIPARLKTSTMVKASISSKPFAKTVATFFHFHSFFLSIALLRLFKDYFLRIGGPSSGSFFLLLGLYIERTRPTPIRLLIIDDPPCGDKGGESPSRGRPVTVSNIFKNMKDQHHNKSDGDIGIKLVIGL